MATDDDFWLSIHAMANSVNHDQQPVSGKGTTLAGYLLLYPPEARKQLREDFQLVLSVLLDLDAKVKKPAENQSLDDLS